MVLCYPLNIAKSFQFASSKTQNNLTANMRGLSKTVSNKMFKGILFLLIILKMQVKYADKCVCVGCVGICASAMRLMSGSSRSIGLLCHLTKCQPHRNAADAN